VLGIILIFIVYIIVVKKSTDIPNIRNLATNYLLCRQKYGILLTDELLRTVSWSTLHQTLKTRLLSHYQEKSHQTSKVKKETSLTQPREASSNINSTDVITGQKGKRDLL